VAPRRAEPARRAASEAAAAEAVARARGGLLVLLRALLAVVPVPVAGTAAAAAGRAAAGLSALARGRGRARGRRAAGRRGAVGRRRRAAHARDDELPREAARREEVVVHAQRADLGGRGGGEGRRAEAEGWAKRPGVRRPCQAAGKRAAAPPGPGRARSALTPAPAPAPPRADLDAPDARQPRALRQAPQVQDLGRCPGDARPVVDRA
jgi:hypothetical protein